MRYMFGLVGLLVTIGIMVYLMSMQLDRDTGTIRRGMDAQDQAQQISGRGEDGVPATESFTAEGQVSGGQLRGLLVTAVVPGGAMDQFYGLKKDDKILAVGGNDLASIAPGGDEELAKAQVVQEGFSKQQPITVERAGQRLELPRDKNVGATPAAAQAPGAAPAAPAEQPAGQSGDPLQRQLDAIPGIAR